MAVYYKDGKSDGTTLATIEPTEPAEPAEEEFKLPPILSDVKGVFNIQHTRFMLTYKTHLRKSELHDFIESKTKHTSFVFIRSAHENADDKNPYPHTHCLVQVKMKKQSKDPRTFDYKGIHPHIQLISTNGHWDNCKHYLGKEDPSNSDLKKGAALIDIIKSKDTLIEALRMGKKFGDLSGIATSFALVNGGDKETINVDWRNFCPWQEMFYKDLEAKSNDRTIIWIYDKQGTTGKSTFAKLLAQDRTRFDRKFLYLDVSDDKRDFFESLKTELEKGWTSHCLFVDISRSEVVPDKLYGIMEHVKNGSITCSKWKGGVTILPKCPHIVILANTLPNMKKWTWDRYDIRTFEGKSTGSSRLGTWNGDKVKMINVSLTEATGLLYEQKVKQQMSRIREKMEEKMILDEAIKRIKEEDGMDAEYNPF